MSPLTKYKFNESLLSFLKGNTAIDFFRSRATRDKNLECELNDFFSEQATPAEIEKKTEREWSQHLLALALKNLSERFSSNVIEAYLYSVQGNSHADIAEKLGLGQDSIKVYKARVKKALAQEILRLNNYLWLFCIA